jgi:Tfp pilus assembly protein PilN
MRAVNLIPVQQRGGASVGAGRSEGGAYAVLALLAGLAALAFVYGSAHHTISSKSGEAATITAQAHAAQAATEQLAPYTSFLAMREQRTQAVNQLVDSRFDWAHVFHEFARVLPAGVQISSLDGTVGTVAPAAGGAPAAAAPAAAAPAAAGTASASTVTSATPPGSVPTFTLSGCARTQQEVARMLTQLRLMDGVSHVTLQSSVKTTVGGAAASAGGCPTSAPVFAAEISFQPLPTPSAKAPQTQTATVAAVSTSASGGTSR